MNAMDTSSTLKTKLQEKHDPATSHIILDPPVEFWNIDTQFGRASCYINHPANLPTLQLADTS